MSVWSVSAVLAFVGNAVWLRYSTRDMHVSVILGCLLVGVVSGNKNGVCRHRPERMVGWKSSKWHQFLPRSLSLEPTFWGQNCDGFWVCPGSIVVRSWTQSETIKIISQCQDLFRNYKTGLDKLTKQSNNKLFVRFYRWKIFHLHYTLFCPEKMSTKEDHYGILVQISILVDRK